MGFAIDNGPNVGFQQHGVAYVKLVHRTFNHGERFVGDAVLQAEDAQRGAALSCAIKGGVDDIGDYLLGQGGAIHNHGVLPACFGNQHGVVFALGKGAVDELGNFG